MGKSVGFIGNFKGKLGNAVGYKVSQSNSGTNQGVRVYQPNIKNPKSAAQAEQRAKYAPIFATYNAFKSIIDRGNESKAYGNASRIAWLKKAFRAELIPWYTRGSVIKFPVVCQLTNGTLPSMDYYFTPDYFVIKVPRTNVRVDDLTIGQVSACLMEQYSWMKQGDQVTLAISRVNIQPIASKVISFIIDTTNITAFPHVHWEFRELCFDDYGDSDAGVCVVSRQGSHGEHLRSSETITMLRDNFDNPVWSEDSKQAAIASYMAADSANADWAEESIQ